MFRWTRDGAIAVLRLGNGLWKVEVMPKHGHDGSYYLVVVNDRYALRDDGTFVDRYDTRQWKLQAAQFHMEELARNAAVRVAQKFIETLTVEVDAMDLVPA